VAGLSSNLNLLEDFSPARTVDLPRWIPLGLYYDMIDVRNETGAPVIDGVLNYTSLQFFSALDNDINSLPASRMRLLSENGNNQNIQVTVQGLCVQAGNCLVFCTIHVGGSFYFPLNCF
jgi:hypothetical protein